MRTTLLALGAIVAVLASGPRAAEARTWYPYCATYADASGMTRCSFATFEQCRASVSGIGGSCKRNPAPPPVRRARPAPPPRPAIPSQAPARQWHPYCATYADAFGTTSCAFDTYEECKGTLGGNEGFCKDNPFQPDGSRSQVRQPR